MNIMTESPCRMRGLFGEGMTEAHQVLHVANPLINQYHPRLARHFDREQIHISMFATQWLLTMYTSSFPFDVVTRVWDAYYQRGGKLPIVSCWLYWRGLSIEEYVREYLTLTFEEGKFHYLRMRLYL